MYTVEIIVTKREIVHFKQFLFLPQCYQSILDQNASASEKMLPRLLTHLSVISGPQLQHVKEIARALRCIADDLDQDQRIQRYPEIALNPFPHTDAFRCLCSRQLFESSVAKEEFAQNNQFFLLSTCFQLYIKLLFFQLKGFFVLFPRRFQSRLLQICCMWEMVNPFPHTANMQQTAFEISRR